VWNPWRAKRHERSQPSDIKSFDGQRKQRFIFCPDKNGAPTMKFGETATNSNVTFAAE
jgi:hypothetical protein